MEIKVKNSNVTNSITNMKIIEDVQQVAKSLKRNTIVIDCFMRAV